MNYTLVPWILVCFACANAYSQDGNDDFSKNTRLWHELKPLATFTGRIPDQLRMIEIGEAATLKSTRILTNDLQSGSRFETTVEALPFALGADPSKLLPLVFANSERVQHMVQQFGNDPTKLPPESSVELQVLSVFRHEIETENEKETWVYFQVDVKILFGTSMSVAAKPELWRFDGKRFEWLKRAQSWASGN